MKIKGKRSNALQMLCCSYLCRLKGVASKHGLNKWLEETLQANKKGQCAATIEDVDMLSRLVNEERINRQEVPSYLGVSYRRCVESEVFEGDIRNLGHQGVYSKVDAVLEGVAKYGKDINQFI